jgi:hypothetical protein
MRQPLLLALALGSAVTAAADVSCDGAINLTDLTLLINHLFVNQAPLCCEL